MWAPADIFSPTVNAVALFLQRTMTVFWNNAFLVVLVVAVIILLLIVVTRLRRDRA